jgi:hypothetical protein
MRNCGRASGFTRGDEDTRGQPHFLEAAYVEAVVLRHGSSIRPAVWVRPSLILAAGRGLNVDR